MSIINNIYKTIVQKHARQVLQFVQYNKYVNIYGHTINIEPQILINHMNEFEYHSNSII